MSCKWCHNPESLDPKPLAVFDPKKCIKCGHCENSQTAYFHNENCLTDICPTGARETIGYEISSGELMSEIKKDLPFYEQSGGGVTFSGGEPFYQAEFLLAALTGCGEEHINTAIDTSGYCDTGALLKAAETANYFLYDIKFFDSEKHEKFCGAPNDLILKNLERLSETKAKIFVRIPVIPTINDDMAEMTAIYQFISVLKSIQTVHLLPYHNIHAEKYRKIGKQYELAEISGDESPNMNAIKDLFAARFPTKVGG